MIWGPPPMAMGSDRPAHLPPRPAPMRHGRNGHHRGRNGNDGHDRGGGSVLNYG